MRVWDRDIDFCYISLDKKLYQKKKKEKEKIQKCFNLWHSIQNFYGLKIMACYVQCNRWIYQNLW